MAFYIFTALYSADKFFNKQQIFGLIKEGIPTNSGRTPNEPRPRGVGQAVSERWGKNKDLPLVQKFVSRMKGSKRKIVDG